MANEHAPIKTYLVCGFLGAGKTTFILEQLKTASSNVAVLVNEFGALGVDGETIRSQGGIDVVELPGGCICCSQQQGLIANIKEVASIVKPELLLIEPSGVAEASELLKTLVDESLRGVVRLDGVITVIDASTFMEFSEPDAFGAFFFDQVENADIVLINKKDLVPIAKRGAIEARIAAINPQAMILAASFCQVDVALPDSRGINNIALHGDPRRLKLSSISVEPKCPVSRDELERFLGELAEGNLGTVVRAKGFLRVDGYGCVSIQITPGQALIELHNREVPSRLIVIGFDLDEDSLLDNLELATV